MIYILLFTEEAERFLRKADRAVHLRIVRKLHWLRENLDDVKVEGLRSDLAGQLKLREGDYRILYTLDYTNGRIIVERIGHRSEIYKK